MKVDFDPTILLCGSADKSEQNGVKGLNSSGRPQKATGLSLKQMQNII